MPKTIYDDLKSPMYATSVGLLIKGIQKAEKRQRPNPPIELHSDIT